mmetsp:Transcript_70766/g.184518  ORF Transcript_70766/g.184518 Transcript_70766/m.184518 type:complete len:242 (-) Transcript_70766:809-1534(-)
MSSSGTWSIQGSLSSVISSADRSFFVFSVPPIICASARCPASFSLSCRWRSSSFAAASASRWRSSSEIHFATEISPSLTWSTESASSQSCSRGSSTSSSTCSSLRMALMRAVFSLIWSIVALLSPWAASKSLLKASRKSHASACSRKTCSRLREFVSSSNGSYRSFAFSWFPSPSVLEGHQLTMYCSWRDEKESATSSASPCSPLGQWLPRSVCDSSCSTLRMTLSFWMMPCSSWVSFLTG